MEKKQELTEEDVEEMFDPALTRHKGQVRRHCLLGRHTSHAAMAGTLLGTRTGA